MRLERLGHEILFDVTDLNSSSGPTAPSLPTTKFIDLLELEPTPWANAKGVTRLIASGSSSQRAPQSQWLWKLSLATLSEDAEFSALAGVDRLFTLASDGPINLSVAGTPHQLTLGDQQSFDGAEAVHAQIPTGPQFALNLMLRSGQGAGSVRILRTTGIHDVEPSTNYQLLVVLQGSVTVRTLAQATPLTAIIPDPAGMSFHSEDAVLAHVQIFS